MSNSFNNFLSNRGPTNFKSYTHATKLYVDGDFARAPKLGFLYFVSFNINPGVVKLWPANGQRDVGLLVKKVDQPKFKIATETVNQYNRKTNIQTKITYEPISIEFHDDNSDITNNLWTNYFKFYYKDSDWSNSNSPNPAFIDTKYNNTDYQYGFYDNGTRNAFFESIDIFVLHQHKFSQVRVVNPLITVWDHDSLDQNNGTKTLQNKMTVVYENVYYYTGNIVPGDTPNGFAARYYDNVQSPLQAGNRNPDGTQVSSTDVYGNAKAAQKISNVPPNSGPSISQLDKAQVQKIPRYGAPIPMSENGAPIIPVYGSPSPIGAGIVGLGSQSPSTVRSAGVNLWYGQGGIHGKLTVAAAPVRLVLKK